MQAIRKAQAGFTLIELLIVVAIVGILAAVAIPAYQDYTKKAKLSEPLAKLDEMKLQAMEYLTTKGDFVGYSLGGATYTSQYVSAISIGGTPDADSAEVQVTVQGVHTDVNGAKLCLTTDDSGKTWVGHGKESGATKIKSLMPKNFVSTTDCQ